MSHGSACCGDCGIPYPPLIGSVVSGMGRGWLRDEGEVRFILSSTSICTLIIQRALSHVSAVAYV
jgi:hypothetical protein